MNVAEIASRAYQILYLRLPRPLPRKEARARGLYGAVVVPPRGARAALGTLRLRRGGGRGSRGGGHGSHSSSARRHKSVRFATTIDDGGQRTGSRGRYSPPPSQTLKISALSLQLPKQRKNFSLRRLINFKNSWLRQLQREMRRSGWFWRTAMASVFSSRRRKQSYAS